MTGTEVDGTVIEFLSGLVVALVMALAIITVQAIMGLALFLASIYFGFLIFEEGLTGPLMAIQRLSNEIAGMPYFALGAVAGIATAAIIGRMYKLHF